MRGVCVDCTNRPPTARQIRYAGLDSIRIEMRDLPSFYDYTNRTKIKQAWLLGPSTGPIEPILQQTEMMPSLLIIGNEPDLDGASSWTMSQLEYVDLWNRTAPLFKDKWPEVPLVTAGMHYPEYLWGLWQDLKPRPDFVNLHYPKSIDQFLEFSRDYQCIVGEWCWRDASRREMHDWIVHFLDYYAWDYFWFCWADYMVPGMGLVTQTGRTTKAYHYLKEAIQSLT